MREVGLTPQAWEGLIIDFFHLASELSFVITKDFIHFFSTKFADLFFHISVSQIFLLFPVRTHSMSFCRFTSDSGGSCDISGSNFVSHFYERVNVISDSSKYYGCCTLELNKTKVFCHVCYI